MSQRLKSEAEELAGQEQDHAAEPLNDPHATDTAGVALNAVVASAANDVSGESVTPPELRNSRPSLVPRVVQGSKRWLFIAKHYAWTSVLSKRWWFLVLATVIQLVGLAWPLLKFGWAAFSLSSLLIVGGYALKRWRENKPQHQHIVERNYDERKLMLYKLIHALQERELMTPPQRQAYQREVLELIACYVRDHRRDWAKTTIFANLLVEEDDELVVVARDRDHRDGRARYPKQQMLAWTAISTGAPALTGDVHVDFPKTDPGKPYSSILAIPIHRNGVVVGAVSIDSSQRYHFDLDAQKLVDYLRPYVALLAWTLPIGNATLMLRVGK